MTVMYFWTPLSRLTENVGVDIFSAVHLIWLFGSLTLSALAVYLFSRSGSSARGRFLLGAGWVLLFAEIFRQILYVWSGDFSVEESLPLHLCDVMIFVEFYAVISGGAFTKELCFCLGFPGAFFALLTPGETAYPFWNVFYLLFILLHLLLFLIPLLMIADGFKPDIRRTPKCFLFLLGIAAFDGVFNRIFSSNYLFLSHAPYGSILEVLQDAAGFWYIPCTAGLVVLIWAFLYGAWYLLSSIEGSRSSHGYQ